MLRDGGLTPKHYVAAISDSGRCHRWKEACNIWSNISRDGLRQSVFSCSALLSVCEKADEWTHAIGLLDTMLKSQVQPNSVSFNVSISCQKRASWPRAFSLVNMMSEMGVRQCGISRNSAISACERPGLWQEALSLLGNMQVRSSVITFNATIGVKGSWQTALSVCHSIPQSELQNTSVSYGAVMTSCGANWLCAICLFQDLERALQPSCINYTAAMSVCERAGQWQCAVSLFYAMLERKILPNQVCLNVAISACGAQWQLASSILSDFPQYSVRPGSTSFGAAISACESQGAWRAAIDMLEAMPQSIVEPDTICFSAAISSCATGEWQLALRFFYAMVESDLQRDTISFSAAITSCEKVALWMQAMGLFHSISKCHVRANVTSSNAAMSSVQRLGLWHMALGHFETMARCNCEANVISFNATISSCEKGQRWLYGCQLLGAMRLSVRPNAISLNATMSSCEKAGRWRHVLSTLQSLRGDELEPGTLAFNAAIASCDRAARWGFVFSLFADLPEGVQANVITIDAAISSGCRGGQAESVLSLLNRLQTVATATELIEAKGAGFWYWVEASRVLKGRFWHGSWHFVGRRCEPTI